MLLNESCEQQNKLSAIKQKDEVEYNNSMQSIMKKITNANQQFSNHCILKKVQNFMERLDDECQPNIYESRKGTDLAPLLEGMIQYSKCMKKHNFQALRDECVASNLAFDEKITFTALKKMIMKDENDAKFFKPKTYYNTFKWNETHFVLNE